MKKLFLPIMASVSLLLLQQTCYAGVNRSKRVDEGYAYSLSKQSHTLVSNDDVVVTVEVNSQFNEEWDPAVPMPPSLPTGTVGYWRNGNEVGVTAIANVAEQNYQGGVRVETSINSHPTRSVLGAGNSITVNGTGTLFIEIGMMQCYGFTKAFSAFLEFGNPIQDELQDELEGITRSTPRNGTPLSVPITFTLGARNEENGTALLEGAIWIQGERAGDASTQGGRG
jgi:hypothetical protein